MTTTEIDQGTDSALAETASLAHAVMAQLAELAKQPVDAPETLTGVLEAFALTLESATQAIGFLGDRLEDATLRRDLVGIPGPDPERDVRNALAALDSCHDRLRRAAGHCTQAKEHVANLKPPKAAS